VKSGAAIDYETATSHALTITATDQTGRAYSKTLTVAVDNVSGTVTGTAAGETLASTSEEDVISGLDGDDRLLGSAGADKLDGGAGTDTVDYSTAPSGLTVSLAHVDRNTGEAAGDTYVLIERLVGSYHADLLYGNRWTSTEIDGGAGDDRLFGFGDSDTLLGNLGTDRLYGGDGGDILIGGQDYDVLYGEGGDDLLDGVDGETVKVADHLVGGLGDDHYIVDGDTVIEAAGQGFDTVETRSSMTLRAGVEIEFLLGTTSAATKLVGNELNQDIVDFSGRAAELRGMGGADYLEGNAGNDTLWGDFGGGTGIGVAGNDELRGGAGNDWLYGEGGDDQLFGEGDNDRLYAGAGSDFGYGGAGEDILYGEAGNDTLSGGRGVDLLSGGEGADTFVYATGDGNDVIFDFSVGDSDKVSLVGVTFVSGAYAGTMFAELSDGALLRAVNGHVWTRGDFIV
jgi:Ca2+-binding RTX toxin-like protein